MSNNGDLKASHSKAPTKIYHTLQLTNLNRPTVTDKERPLEQQHFTN